MSEEGKTSGKRSLEETNDLSNGGESIEDDAPPRKKPKLSSHSKSEPQSENKSSMEEKSDVRTVLGYNRPTHFEISATDTAKIIDFYTKVFDWKFTKMPNMNYWGIQTGKYSFGKHKNEALSTYGLDGGLQPREGDAPSGDTPNTFMLYIDICDIDETMNRIKKNGGTIIKDKTDIGSMGFLAHAKDIEGGLIGLWQNSKPVHEKCNENGKEKEKDSNEGQPL